MFIIVVDLAFSIVIIRTNVALIHMLYTTAIMIPITTVIQYIYKYSWTLSFQIRTGLLISVHGDTSRDIQIIKAYPTPTCGESCDV